MTTGILLQFSPEEFEIRVEAVVERMISKSHAPAVPSGFEGKPWGIDEFCAYTGYSKGYTYKGTADRTIPHTKARNGKLFFWKKDIDEWLKSGRRATQDEITAAVDKQLSK